MTLDVGELWRLRYEAHTTTCEMHHDSSGNGWQVVIRVDDELVNGRWWSDESQAREYATTVRDAYERGGWTQTGRRSSHRLAEDDFDFS